MEATRQDEVEDGDDVAAVAGDGLPQRFRLLQQLVAVLPRHVVQALQQPLAPVTCATGTHHEADLLFQAEDGSWPASDHNGSAYISTGTITDMLPCALPFAVREWTLVSARHPDSFGLANGGGHIPTL